MECHMNQLNRLGFVVHASQAVQAFPAFNAPIGIMWVVLNLSTDELLQQVVNVHVMHSSSQLHCGAARRRIIVTLYRTLECLLCFFFCFSACRGVAGRCKEAAGAAS